MIYPSIFTCACGCNETHISLAFTVFEVESCRELLSKCSDNTAKSILESFNEGMHSFATDEVAAGMFTCELCRHLSISLQHKEYQYLKDLARRNNMTDVIKTLE